MDDNTLKRRVNDSLNKQYYKMNYSWLSDCVDFYRNDHPNSTLEELIAFVMNQWTLYDLREINNENGCLPRNLATQKCLTLQGKYILQVNKMYDISKSKYKQLEGIRNISSENIEATENENKTQGDKFQTWEPKSKRMYQFFLTDGIQDILAIEFNTIRFLKGELLPGYKVMVKGPVICRKGVLLLEENNLVEIGGEVDSLLIPNALENVLARALNLEETTDPYNDTKRKKQSTQNTQNIAQLDDDFDIDAEAIDQIDKQIQQQSANASKAISNLSSKLNLSSNMSEFNYSYQTPNISNQTQKSNAPSARNQTLSSGRSLNNQNSRPQQRDNNRKVTTDFDDEGDSFLEMVDDSEFKTPSVSIAPTVQNNAGTATSKTKADEFPDDDEIYDLVDNHSSFFTSSKSQPQSTTTKIDSQKKEFSGSATSSYNCTSKMTSQNKPNVVVTPSVSDIDNFDFNDDIGMDLDAFEDDFDFNPKDNVKNSKFPEASTSSTPKVKSKLSPSERSPWKFNTESTKSSASSSDTYCENQFQEEFYQSCKKKLLAEKSSQASSKSLPKLKPEEPGNKCTSAQVTKKSSTKLSDKLKLDDKTKDYYSTNSKVVESNYNSNQTSSNRFVKSNDADTVTKNSAFQTNKSSSTKTKFGSQNSYENLAADFENEFDIEFEARMEVDDKPVQETTKNTLKLDREKSTASSNSKSQDSVDNNFDVKSSGFKRTASPSVSSRQKLRCLESTPKDKINSRKITDFFDKPKPKLLNEDVPISVYEAICDVLENSRKTDKVRSVVRGKVINVVKLNLSKGENGSYFQLDATITDGTANLDITFSSQVLEEIVGYSAQEFILKRKRAKANPSIKNELRDDLLKAQNILRTMDALMEIEVKKDEKTTILAVKPLTKEEKKRADERLQRYKVEKK